MISKAHRSVVEVLLYAIVCFMCFSKFVLMRIGALINVDYLSSSAAAVPLVVRWRTDALSEDYAEVRNKAAVIAFSIVAQCAAAIACKHSAVHYDCASIYFYSVAKIHAAFLGLLISAFNRMEIKERDLSIPDDESSFWNSDRSKGILCQRNSKRRNEQTCITQRQRPIRKGLAGQADEKRRH